MTCGLSGGQFDGVRTPERPEDQAPKLVVQLRDVQQPNVPGVHDDQCGEPRHLIHVSEHAPIRGLCELYAVGDRLPITSSGQRLVGLRGTQNLQLCAGTASARSPTACRSGACVSLV